MRSDERGGTYAEFVLAIIPVLMLSLGILQLTELYTAKLLVDHASLAAARSAVVVFADDPRSYAGEGVATLGPRRTEAIRLSALRAMAPFVVDGSFTTVRVEYPDGAGTGFGSAITAEVHATYRCRVPLVSPVACGTTGERELVSKMTLPSLTARFSYDGGGGAMGLIRP